MFPKKYFKIIFSSLFLFLRQLIGILTHLMIAVLFFWTAPAVFVYAAHQEPESLKIHFINAGEGDSSLIEYGDYHILIDTGNVKTAYHIMEYLKSHDVKSINHLIITHPHPDHFSGVFLIAQHFQVRNFYDNGEDIRNKVHSDDFYRWYQEFFRNDPRYRILRKTDEFYQGRLRLQVLHPDDSLSSDWNANSLVISAEYEKWRILFFGDGNIRTEEKLIQNDTRMRADILKAGHHGASDTASDEFIRTVDPDIVIISVNQNNIRKYPSADTIKKYRDSGSKILITKDDGDITITLNSNHMKIRTSENE